MWVGVLEKKQMHDRPNYKVAKLRQQAHKLADVTPLQWKELQSLLKTYRSLLGFERLDRGTGEQRILAEFKESPRELEILLDFVQTLAIKDLRDFSFGPARSGQAELLE